MTYVQDLTTGETFELPQAQAVEWALAHVPNGYISQRPIPRRNAERFMGKLSVDDWTVSADVDEWSV